MRHKIGSRVYIEYSSDYGLFRAFATVERRYKKAGGFVYIVKDLNLMCDQVYPSVVRMEFSSGLWIPNRYEFADLYVYPYSERSKMG